MLNIFK